MLVRNKHGAGCAREEASEPPKGLEGLEESADAVCSRKQWGLSIRDVFAPTDGSASGLKPY